MDLGLRNYFFEHEQGFYFGEDYYGYKMTYNEDIFIFDRDMITKETFIEVSSYDDYLQNGHSITKKNINLERIRFQVDNNTMIHYFALDYDILSLVVDYMEEHRSGYLSAILMPNSKGKSALDITIDSESPKNAELMLRKLLLFSDQKLSHLIYNKFTQLLRMDIKAFYEYLES